MFVVNEGRSVTTRRRGIKGPGDEVTVNDFTDESFKELSLKGFISEIKTSKKAEQQKKTDKKTKK